MHAWQQADFAQHFLNSSIITVPAVLLTLFCRRSWRSCWPGSASGSTCAAELFTAGNLLPQQVLLTPLYRLYTEIPLPEWMSDSGIAATTATGGSS